MRRDGLLSSMSVNVGCKEEGCAMRSGHVGPHRDRNGRSWPPEAVEREGIELRQQEEDAIFQAKLIFRGTPVFACRGLMYGVGKGYIKAERCYPDVSGARLGFVFSFKSRDGQDGIGIAYCPFCGVKTLGAEAQCTKASR